MSITAICTVANLDGVNADLQTAGFGPDNFSVPVYNGNVRASHATLHCWDIPEFFAALQADGRVTVTTSEVGSPRDRVQALIDGQGLSWPGNAPTLPDSGTISPGEYYRYARGDLDTEFWLVIQSHDRAVFGGDPAQYPALIRQARVPGQIASWKQPIDQFDAYKLVDPFTGEGEQVTHNGQTWQVTQADGAGNNVWEPGVFGWTVV